MSCSKFCKGGQQSNNGLIARRLDTSIFEGENPSSLLLKKQTAGGLFLCPLGCTQNPLSEEATANAIVRGGKDSICHNNKWLRPLTIDKED